MISYVPVIAVSRGVTLLGWTSSLADWQTDYIYEKMELLDGYSIVLG